MDDEIDDLINTKPTKLFSKTISNFNVIPFKHGDFEDKPPRTIKQTISTFV